MSSLLESSLLDFYKDKNVFITGHTGFKGAWLSFILAQAGANVTGYSLPPPTEPSLFNIAKTDSCIKSVIGDVRDFDKMKAAFDAAAPRIVFHLAAQPIVLDGYREPRLTYETNVMGTVNILECVRGSTEVKSFLNITTDKVYENRETAQSGRAFTETDTLDGTDPYSNSKSCSELVTHCYKASMLKIPASTARSGNVIGGGDFSPYRIIPDCVRAARNKTNIIVRNPGSVRPYQHVLEALFAYLLIAAKQYGDPAYAGYYNVGADDRDCVNTGTLADLFCDIYADGNVRREAYNPPAQSAPREAEFLKLDCSKMKRVFGWSPEWNIDTSVAKTVEWTKVWLSGGDVREVMRRQVCEFAEAFGIGI